MAVLAALALLALATQAVTSVVSQQVQRDREEQLLRIGEEFARAFQTYYEASPGSVKQFPRTLDDLVEDRRFVGIRRHLRRIYGDPITGEADWDLLVRSDGSIRGVRSKSTASPLRSSDSASKYSDWVFTYVPPQETLR